MATGSTDDVNRITQHHLTRRVTRLIRYGIGVDITDPTHSRAQETIFTIMRQSGPLV